MEAGWRLDGGWMEAGRRDNSTIHHERTKKNGSRESDRS